MGHSFHTTYQKNKHAFASNEHCFYENVTSQSTISEHVKMKSKANLNKPIHTHIHAQVHIQYK